MKKLSTISPPKWGFQQATPTDVPDLGVPINSYSIVYYNATSNSYNIPDSIEGDDLGIYKYDPTLEPAIESYSLVVVAPYEIGLGDLSQ